MAVPSVPQITSPADGASVSGVVSVEWSESTLPWTPADLPGILLDYNPVAGSVWVDDARTDDAVDTDLVGALDDAISGYHLTEADTAEKPTLDTTDADFNDAPSLTFDGGDMLQTSLSLEPTSQMTILLVMKVVTVANNDRAFASVDGANRQEAYIQDGNWKMFAGAVYDSGHTVTTGAVNLEFHFNGANSFVAVNGSESTPGDAGSAVLRGFTLGAYLTGGTNKINAKYARVIGVEGTVSSADRTNWRNYVASEYGVS